MRTYDDNMSNCGVFEDHVANRVTATENIDGVQHLLVLEQDDTGCYREVILEPLALHERERLAQSAP